MNPYSEEVELAFALNPLPKEGIVRWDFLGWNPTPDFPVLRYFDDAQRQTEITRVDLLRGEIIGRTWTRLPFGVDAQGRVWGCEGEEIM